MYYRLAKHRLSLRCAVTTVSAILCIIADAAAQASSAPPTVERLKTELARALARERNGSAEERAHAPGEMARILRDLESRGVAAAVAIPEIVDVWKNATDEDNPFVAHETLV